MPDMDYLTVDQLKAVLGISKPQFDDALQLAIFGGFSGRSMNTAMTSLEGRRYDGPDLSGVERASVDVAVVRHHQAAWWWPVDMDDNGSFETTWTAGVQLPGDTPVASSRVAVHRACHPGFVVFPRCPGRLFRPPGPGVHLPGVLPGLRVRQRLVSEQPAGPGAGHRDLGWPSVPAPVVQACQVQAIDYFKSKELTGSSYGGMATGIRGYLSGCNEMACALLMSYRSHVVA